MFGADRAYSPQSFGVTRGNVDAVTENHKIRLSASPWEYVRDKFILVGIAYRGHLPNAAQPRRRTCLTERTLNLPKLRTVYSLHPQLLVRPGDLLNNRLTIKQPLR